MNNKLEKYFKDNQQYFDIQEPEVDHFKRFENKLKKINKRKSITFQKWYVIAAAASIILFIGIGIGFNFSNQQLELAHVSPKMEETQMYFASVINIELEKVKSQKNSYNEQVITDALVQLKILEDNYNKLTYELYESSEDRRIIYAMISNFQQRIQLLETLLNQIDTINQLKSKNYETHV
jgi:hypothetical protein